jgi:choline dehydrogenase-like flavoprotein
MALRRLLESANQNDTVDIQRSTLSLDVVPRYVCSTWDEAVNNGGNPFDAVVIGAGMFGGYCAEKIFRIGSPKGRRVLVLDAGPFLVSSHIQNIPQIGLNVPPPMTPSDDNGAPRELVWGMPWRSNVDFVGQAYCVGGKSLYWGGWCPRLLDSDLASWPPEVRAYLERTYPLLEQQTGVDQRTQFIQGKLFDLLKARTQEIISAKAVPNLDSVQDPPLAVEGHSPASGLFSFDKYSSITLLIDAVREAARNADRDRRLFVVPNAHVTRLSAKNGTVTAVHAFVGGQEKVLEINRGCAVVLAAGIIESTRLALLSFPTSEDPAQELMGRNLMSHVRTNAYVRLRRSALDPAGTLPSLLQTGALYVRGSTGDGKFAIQVTASADVGLNSDLLLYSMIPDIDQLAITLRNQGSEWISITLRAESEMKGDTTSSVPNAVGRWINLSPYERDEFGVPRAYVHFTTTPAENTLAAVMDQAVVNLAKALANNNPADVQVTGPIPDPLGSTYHEAGTLWMGPDPKASVTDENGRFHHVSNAYCCDQSLFVNVGSVNPTLTGLVLARKVAEAIA